MSNINTFTSFLNFNCEAQKTRGSCRPMETYKNYLIQSLRVQAQHLHMVQKYTSIRTKCVLIYKTRYVLKLLSPHTYTKHQVKATIRPASRSWPLKSIVFLHVSCTSCGPHLFVFPLSSHSTTQAILMVLDTWHLVSHVFPMPRHTPLTST